MGQHGNYTHDFENNWHPSDADLIKYPKEEPSKTDYHEIGRAQAKLFAADLRDLYTRYQYSTVGDMERSGMLTAGEDILSALSKIELFKQSL